MLTSRHRTKQIVWGCLFLSAFFLLQKSIVNDYGVHWDEYNNQGFGYYWLNHIITQVTGKDQLHLDKSNSEHDIIHGPFYEIFLLVTCNNLLGISNSEDIIKARHLLVSLTFLAANICLYILLILYFDDWRMGLLGNLLFICNPRIFAHSFYNSADIPFLCFYMFNLLTLSLLLRKANLTTMFFHSLLSAMLIDIRLIGIFAPCITLLFFIAELCFIPRAKQSQRKLIKLAFVYVILVTVFSIAFWPYLWEHTLERIYLAFTTTPGIHWDGKVLFCGRSLKGSELPRTYLPVWISISIPITFLLLFAIGLSKTFLIFSEIVLWHKKQRYLRLFALCYRKHRNRLIITFAFLIPFLAVIILKPVIYDSWRHMFFLYAPMTVLMLFGVKSTTLFFRRRFSSKHAKLLTSVLILLISASIINTIAFMISSHPLQQIFFNRLAGSNMLQISKRFELDYWGLSYRKGLEYVLKHDSSRKIIIYDTNLPIRTNAMILPKKQRKRLAFTKNLQICDYYITNFRNNVPPSGSVKRYSVKVGGAEVLGVFKLTHH